MADYKKTVDEGSSSTKPKEIILLEKQIESHPDIAKKSNGRAKLFTEFPFLLHTNWCHDGWIHKGILQTREVNHERIQRGGAPVWAAVDALLGVSDSAKRMIKLITYAIHNTCMELYTIPDGDIEKDMASRLMQLLRLHREILPVEMDIKRLAEVDMVAFFIAVLVDILAFTEKICCGNVSSNEDDGESKVADDGEAKVAETLEEMICAAERNERLNQDDAKILMTFVKEYFDNCDMTDMDHKAKHISRVELMITNTRTTRPRIRTARFVDIEHKPAKKRKAKNMGRTPSETKEKPAKKAKLRKVNDNVMCLQSPEELGWIHGKITRVNRAGTYTIK